jgi:hypothetical protein
MIISNLRIRACNLFQFRTASETINEFYIWQNFLYGISQTERIYLFRITQHRKRRTSVP